MVDGNNLVKKLLLKLKNRPLDGIKSTNQTLVPVEPTTLSPMVQSYLPTFSDGTIHFLFSWVPMKVTLEQRRLND